MYAILRFEKIKSVSKLAAVRGHVTRSAETPNADLARSAAWLIEPTISGKPAPLEDAVTARLPEKKRKDAVLAIGAMLTASPEYFGDPWDKKKVDDWKKSAEKWLSKEFGKNLLGVAIHLDEKTPHIHAYILPMTKDNRLSAKETFNPRILRTYQTSYSSALKHLGLRRGVEGSKAKHQEVQRFYSRITEKIEQPTKTELLKWATTGHVPEKIEMLIDKAVAGDAAIGRIKATKDYIVNLEKEIGDKNKTIEKLTFDLKSYAENARGVDCRKVVNELGGSKIENEDTYLFSDHNLDVKTEVKFNKDNSFEIFKNGKKQKQHKNAIDIVMAVTSGHFEECLNWIAYKFGNKSTINDYNDRNKDEFDRIAIDDGYENPVARWRDRSNLAYQKKMAEKEAQAKADAKDRAAAAALNMALSSRRRDGGHER